MLNPEPVEIRQRASESHCGDDRQILQRDHPSVRAGDHEIPLVTRWRPKKCLIRVDQQPQDLGGGALAAPLLAVKGEDGIGAGAPQRHHQPAQHQVEVLGVGEVEEPRQFGQVAVGNRLGQRQHPARAGEANRRIGDDLPAVDVDLDGAPGGVAKVQVDAAAVWGDAGIDGDLAAVEEGSALQHRERIVDRLRPRHLLGRVEVQLRHPPLHALGSERVGLAPALDGQRRVGHALGVVEQLGAGLERQADEDRRLRVLAGLAPVDIKESDRAEKPES